MTGWMPGAPACRIRARPRSAAEASNSAFAPLWWKNVRRPPSRSIIPSVNEVTAPASVLTPADVDAQPRALGQDEGAVLVVADGAEHPYREGRPEHAQVDGHVEARTAGAQRYLLDRGQMVKGRVGVDHLADINEDTVPGAQHPLHGFIRHAARDRSPPGRPRATRCGAISALARACIAWARDGVGGTQLAPQHRPRQADTRSSCGLRALDLAAEQGEPGAVRSPGAAARRCRGLCRRSRPGCRPPARGRTRPARPARGGRCRPA